MLPPIEEAKAFGLAGEIHDHTIPLSAWHASSFDQGESL